MAHSTRCLQSYTVGAPAASIVHCIHSNLIIFLLVSQTIKHQLKRSSRLSFIRHVIVTTRSWDFITQCLMVNTARILRSLLFTYVVFMTVCTTCDISLEAGSNLLEWVELKLFDNSDMGWTMYSVVVSKWNGLNWWSFQTMEYAVS